MLLAVGLTLVFSLGCSDRLEEARLLEANGDASGAVAAYREVIRRHPDDLPALNGLAVSLLTLQRYDEALRVQERIVALDPADAQTRTELGFNYLNHQNRPADAVWVLSEAAALVPSAKNLTFVAQAQIVAGQAEAAECYLRLAIEADRQYGFAYRVLAELLESTGRDGEAAEVRLAAVQNAL